MSRSHGALNCEDVMERLFGYLDRELDEAARADIEYHLHACRGCFSRTEFERRLRAKLVETATLPAPASLHDRVRTLIERF